MKWLIVVLVVFLFISPGFAQNALTLPIRVEPVGDNKFLQHQSYISGSTGLGIDFEMAVNNDIAAAFDGVAYVHDNGYDNAGGDMLAGYGNYIVVVHTSIDSVDLRIYYAHLTTGTFSVSDSQEVNRGGLLEKSGNSGWSSGAHLHFLSDTKMAYLWIRTCTRLNCRRLTHQSMTSVTFRRGVLLALMNLRYAPCLSQPRLVS